MPEIDSQGPEYERKLTGIEQLVTDGALDILKDFCERRPELAERVELEARKTVEIMADFTMENINNADWRGAYDAALLGTILEYDPDERPLKNYSPEHGFITAEVLADYDALADELKFIRSKNTTYNELVTATDTEGIISPKVFEKSFSYAEARMLDRKTQDKAHHAAIIYASRLLFRMNRTEDYDTVTALKDICDAESVFAPLFQVGYDAFSMALDESAGRARYRRLGEEQKLEVSDYMLHETFGNDPEKTCRDAIEAVFDPEYSSHVDQSGDVKPGLKIASAVGNMSVEHSTVFLVATGTIFGVENAKLRVRVKGSVSLSRKLEKACYKNFDIHDPLTWPQDLMAGTAIIGHKSEDSSESVDMAVEQHNVEGVGSILHKLITYIDLESNPGLRLQASPSRQGETSKPIHVRGDALYTDFIRENYLADVDGQTVDIVNNADRDFQVSKVTFGVLLPARKVPVNTELQGQTRRSRKNSRTGNSAHWLFKLDTIHGRKMTDINKFIATERLSALRKWLRSSVSQSYLTPDRAREYCEKNGYYQLIH